MTQMQLLPSHTELRPSPVVRFLVLKNKDSSLTWVHCAADSRITWLLVTQRPARLLLRWVTVDGLRVETARTQAKRQLVYPVNPPKNHQKPSQKPTPNLVESYSFFFHY